MKFIISHLTFNKDDKKQKRYQVNLLDIIQFYFCLILTDHFLISINANCAKLSDFPTIEEENERLTFADRVEAFNNMSGNLPLGSQKQKKLKNTANKSKSKPKYKRVPFTTKTDDSSSNTLLLEVNIFTLQFNLNSIQEYMIPDVIKDFNEEKDLQNKIFDLIKKIKENSKFYDKNLIEKIKEKMKSKRNSNSEFNQIIKSVQTEIKSLLLSFEIVKNDFYDVITSQSSTASHSFDEYVNFAMSKIDKEREILLRGLSISKLNFLKEKIKANAILMILTKMLELTPEEFKRDEQVLKAILSLN